MKQLNPIFNIKDFILYEDNDILLCHKPAGLAVQTRKLCEKDLESHLRTYLFQTNHQKESYLAIIHRLDQPVEGLVLFAKTKKAAVELTRQLNKNEIVKEYLAITSYVPPIAAQTLTDYLQKNTKLNLSYVVPPSTQGAKKAVLDYTILIKDTKQALLKIRLKTGRHHQIRVQFSHLGTPLLGDQKYGGSFSKNLCLCAYHLSFCHPTNGKLMDFKIQPANPEFFPYITMISD